MKKLVIISHTAHQTDSRGRPVGWGPTVREINFLSNHWQTITHVACLEDKPVEGSSLAYENDNICFKAIPTFGGKYWWQKLDIVWKAPRILYTVHKELRGATEVQIRLPMGIGLVLIPYFLLRVNRKYKLWVKYANNWGQPSKSPSYRLQRFLLKINILNCPVTINGFWSNQPAHCKSFENPCLTVDQYNAGENIVTNKQYTPPYTLIFAGRVDSEKGVDLIIDSIPLWPKNIIKKIHIIGEGPLLSHLKKTLLENIIDFEAHGFVTQETIFDLLSGCHFLLLPSRSEGFPKIVAEAWAYGCIPIVTSVGSIPHYVSDKKNGIILEASEAKYLIDSLSKASELNGEAIKNGRKMASLFTFSAYMIKLKKEVFGGTG